MKGKIKTKIIIILMILIQMIQIISAVPVKAVIEENNEITLLRRS